MLRADEPLSAPPQRVLVAGTSGSGKTTLAARIAEVAGLPHVEIDGLYHGPRWVPRESFVADVEEFSSAPRWVTEWQYGVVRPLLLERCDLLVWLDLPHRTVMRQVVGRTVRRRWRREELWHGNVEPAFHTLLTDREHIVRWAWSTRNKAGHRVAEAVRRRGDLPVVRLRSHRDTEDWLAGLVPSDPGA